MKFVWQIVKGHCRQSQDSLLAAIVLSVMQIETLVPRGGKEMPVVRGGLFREIWRTPGSYCEVYVPGGLKVRAWTDIRQVLVSNSHRDHRLSCGIHGFP
jgi:hypothetical protein